LNHNEFALELYRQLAGSGNLFFSPISIRAALAMALIGARGETATQMSRVLQFASQGEPAHDAFAKVIGRLNASDASLCEVSVASSLWGQKGEPVLPEFLDAVAHHYGGGMNLVDFRSHIEAARHTINEWVEAKTREKIREVIGRGTLGPDPRLIVVNAVYFKGTWVLPFRKSSTREEPFFADGGNARVPLMQQQEGFPYLHADGFQAVDLYYRGGDLSMLVLLPDRKDGLRDLELRLSNRLLDDCISKMRAREVKLFLPQFRLDWSGDLAPPLQTLGMTLAFDSQQADFAGVNGRGPGGRDSLFLSAVLHQALVEVNEEGTEAAAATALVESGATLIATRKRPIPIIRADHPFLFAIRDRKSEAILFMGRVADPSSDS
jgi:serpin B